MEDPQEKTIQGVVSLAFFILFFFSGFFPREGEAIRCAETLGFTNIRITDRDNFWTVFRGGGPGDVVRFRVHATNPAGKEVDTFIFVGWPFMGATLRTVGG